MILNDIRGTRAGQTAFVLGSGPSLGSADPERLHAAGFTITMNSAVLHDKKPDYHIIMDGASPYLRSFDFVVASGAIVPVHIFAATRGMIPKERIVPFECNGIATMSADAQRLSQTITTAVTAAHLAIVLGASRVVLLGCDCGRVDGKRYFYELWDPPGDDMMVPAFKTTGFVRSDRRVEGETDETLKRPIEGGVFGAIRSSWCDIAKKIPSNVKVLSASAPTLTAFPRVSIAEVLA